MTVLDARSSQDKRKRDDVRRFAELAVGSDRAAELVNIRWREERGETEEVGRRQRMVKGMS